MSMLSALLNLDNVLKEGLAGMYSVAEFELLFRS